MLKKIVFSLAIGLGTVSLAPSTGLAWYHHYRPHYSHHYYHGGGDAWAWGLTGLVLGGALVAAATQPVVYAQPPQQVVYAPPPAPVYNYPPNVPPGMCRWERYVLDGYGRTVLDQNGQPVKEYTLGNCQYPPN